MIANHGNAGGGWDANDFCVAKDFREVPDEGYRFAQIAGVPMHLPAATLGGEELHLMAQPLEHPDNRLPGLGKEGVVITGDEKRDAHGPILRTAVF
jgi:hypothetical protein